MLEFLIIFVRFVKTVGRIRQNHVQEFLEKRSVEVVLKIFAINFVDPQSRENFVGVESILEFLIKLVRPSSYGNAAVETDESVCQVLLAGQIILEHLVHQPSLVVMQE